MKFSKMGAAAGALVMALGVVGAANAFPAAGNDSLGPELLITVSAGGVASVGLNPVYATDPGPYDGSDDTYVGVVNNTSGTISTITLTSTNDIFGFDGDGIDGYLSTPITFGAPGTDNPLDTTGYGGPDAYFTNITFPAGTEVGDVNFATPIAAGGTDYFSLEEALTSASFTTSPVTVSSAPEPSVWALMFAGVAFMGAALRLGRRRTAMLQA